MVARDVDQALLDVITEPFCPVAILEIDWAGEIVRVHTGTGEMTWAGHEWRGVGFAAGQVTLPAEMAGSGSLPGSMRVGGSPERIDALLAAAESARGGPVRVWFGALTEPGGNQLEDAEPCFVGIYSIDDVQDVEAAVEGGTVRMIDVALTLGPEMRASTNAIHTLADDRNALGDTLFRWVKAAQAQHFADAPKW